MFDVSFIVKRYKNCSHPDPIKKVSGLEDPRIVSSTVVIKNSTRDVIVTMPDLREMGFEDLKKYKNLDPLFLINWALGLFDDLVDHYIVPVDMQDANIMTNGKSLVLVDYEQFWKWDRNREAYGRWRLGQQIKVWSKKL
tara:strand:- start:170 stop:586 length:417 start_codon:yes stop_codon:yes gene_type:complete